MLMWIFILAAVIAAFSFCICFLINRIGKFYIIQRITCGKKLPKIIIPLILVIISVLIMTAFINIVNAIICIIHLVIIWLICELIALLIKKICKKEFKYYFTGIASIILTIFYMSVGWYYAHEIFTTRYEINTDKDIGELKIVQFADSHIGATFDSNGFSEQVCKMNSEQADIILITGDFVDDGTSREDMISSCKALREFDSKYGVYYVFGNHDKGYYTNESRGWTENDLKENLIKNNVNILEDESVLIDNRFYLIGRADRSEEHKEQGRADIKTLMEGLDRSKYTIVLDHQPNDYEEESRSCADLVLSGHTHGGQFFPINRLGELIAGNDRTYGYEHRENTDFIVTSGIADWEIKFKTGCIAEYVVIDIK